MNRKYISITLLCFMLASMSYIKVFAQEKKFIEGTQGKSFKDQSRNQNSVLSIVPRSPYRTYDGTNNNIGNIQRLVWGAADIPLFREMKSNYALSDPNNAMAGPSRPSARLISNILCDEPVTTFDSRGLSSFVYVFGQFIDHDMSLTPTGTTESVPVLLPGNETVFTEDIPFNRSEVRTGTGVSTAREQSNLNTAWIDASMVYGCDSVRAHWLRTFQNGKMKTSAGNLLPYNTVNGELTGAIDPNAPGMANDNNHTTITFVAGDVRASEHPGITSLHTIFVREHNKICDRLVAQGITDDEIIYQKARKEVGALIQAITYQEFLPAIGITLTPYVQYSPGVRPDIMNTFATGAYRLGHTMVADDIFMRTDDCQDVGPGELDLISAFWNPQLIQDFNVDPFLKGLAIHTQYETDTRINSVLRNFLFNSPNDPVRFGIDLASLNIQRGRDHGLPNYNAVRKHYLGTALTSFASITSNAALRTSLQSLYGNINNIDLWVGMLAEDHLPGKSVGPTVHAMLKLQFEKLRDGDFYFYLHDPYLPANTRNKIINTTLADVIKRNSTLTDLQSNVFFTRECNEALSQTSTTEQKVSSEINLKDDPEIKFYPNPVRDIINLDFANMKSVCTIKIFAVNGALIKTFIADPDKINLQIETKDLLNGSYMMNISSEEIVKSFRFVKISE